MQRLHTDMIEFAHLFTSLADT